MSVAYTLTSKLRRKLKKPLGELIHGSFNETMDKLKALVEMEKPPCVVSVGDVVSKNLTESHIHPHLLILDNKVMRSNIKPIPLQADEEKHVKNPPGTITFEALNAIQEAFKTNRKVKVIVEGEEDLLALAAVLHAPLNSIIVYGQPRKGIVMVKATQQKKAEVAEILKAMQTMAKD
ncbi:MAG: GTP-dependent dephospho-CoA kinase family protein [Candidatus Bathycorpusculaceae bacterium]